MHDTDTDIDALDTLFAGAKADYRALQHAKPLRAATQVEPRRPLRRVALAASIVLAVGAFALLVVAHDPARDAGRALRIAAPGAFPDAPGIRPGLAGLSRPTLPASRPTLEFGMPRRPGGGNG